MCRRALRTASTPIDGETSLSGFLRRSVTPRTSATQDCNQPVIVLLIPKTMQNPSTIAQNPCVALTEAMVGITTMGMPNED